MNEPNALLVDRFHGEDSSSGSVRPGARLGLFFGLALMVWGLLYRLMALAHDSPLSWTFYLLVAAAGVLALRRVLSFRGQMTAGALAVLVASGIYAAFVFVYNGWIDDSLLGAVNEQLAARQSAGAGGLTEIGAGLFAVSVLLQLSIFGIVIVFLVAATGAVRSRWRKAP